MGGGIGMGKTCEPMAESFQCMTKFTTGKKKKGKKIKKKLKKKSTTIATVEKKIQNQLLKKLKYNSKCFS